jgi:hypothetical protein
VIDGVTELEGVKDSKGVTVLEGVILGVTLLEGVLDC